MASAADTEKPFSIGAALPGGVFEHESDSDRASELIRQCLQRDGALVVPCTDGVLRYFGAAIMAQTLIQATVIDVADAPPQP